MNPSSVLPFGSAFGGAARDKTEHYWGHRAADFVKAYRL